MLSGKTYLSKPAVEALEGKLYVPLLLVPKEVVEFAQREI